MYNQETSRMYNQSKKEGYGNPLQLPYRYTKTSTISTNQNSKFRCIPVVGNITNIRRTAQKTTEPAPPNSDE